MGIVKSITRLSLVSLVLAGVPAGAAEGDRYWAVATAWGIIGPEGGFQAAAQTTWGAAWDYASLEEAREAAMASCRKHVPDPWNSRRWAHDGCKHGKSGKNSCFAIVRAVTHDKVYGTYRAFGVLGKGYPSRAAAEAAARRRAADTFTNDPERVRHEVGTIELVECAGVE